MAALSAARGPATAGKAAPAAAHDHLLAQPLSDWAACSAWSRHTITVKNDASCSLRFDIAIRNMTRVVPASAVHAPARAGRRPLGCLR